MQYNVESRLSIGFKEIVAKDFEWLQIILMNRLGVPDVPLEVYYFLNFRFHIFFLFKVLSGLSFY